jgi:hypothetical protein
MTKRFKDSPEPNMVRPGSENKIMRRASSWWPTVSG